jgi:hypothetical protein
MLVVEDDLDTVHTLVALLRSEGHEVEYAIHGYAAISLASSFGRTSWPSTLAYRVWMAMTRADG